MCVCVCVCVEGGGGGVVLWCSGCVLGSGPEVPSSNPTLATFYLSGFSSSASYQLPAEASGVRILTHPSSFLSDVMSPIVTLCWPCGLLIH